MSNGSAIWSLFFFFKQKTAYEMRISDWSSDVCSSDLDWQGEQARRLLEQGVTLADPARFDLRGELHCGRDVFIDVGCVFEGRVELADGVRIGPHCVIKDAVVGAGTHIEAFSHVHDARVADEIGRAHV